MHEKVSLTCTLCYDNFTKSFPQKVPRSLQCRHAFCTECIGKLQSLQGDVIDCPSCQTRTLLPDNGVDGLPETMEVLNAVFAKQKAEAKTCNFCIRKIYPPKTATMYCKNCQVYYCGTCSDDIHMEPEFQAHEISLVTALQQKRKSSGSTRSSSGFGSEASFPSTLTRSRSSSSLLDSESVPECPDHGQKMKIYCRTDRCLCCSECKIKGPHKDHDCFEVHEAEERERHILTRLQNKVELHGEKYIRARGDVQKMIEAVKHNTITIKDVSRRYYREMRKAIDEAEKLLLDDISKRSESKLRLLNEQLTQMIEISSQAKRSSRNCDNALAQDYYTMLNMRKGVEEEMSGVLNMVVNTEPVAQADLKCQFPQHEALVNSMRTCAKLVVTPSPPQQLCCKAMDDSSVEVVWDPPEANLYVYPVTCYILQSSIGTGDGFVDVYKTKQNRVVFNPKRDTFLPSGSFIQFRVSAFNLVGQGPWCNPTGIRVPDI